MTHAACSTVDWWSCRETLPRERGVLMTDRTDRLRGDLMMEFFAICEKKSAAVCYSEEELQIFIERCRMLRGFAEGLDETARDQYLGQLRLCEEVFGHFLELKKERRGM